MPVTPPRSLHDASRWRSMLVLPLRSEATRARQPLHPIPTVSSCTLRAGTTSLPRHCAPGAQCLPRHAPCRLRTTGTSQRCRPHVKAHGSRTRHAPRSLVAPPPLSPTQRTTSARWMRRHLASYSSCRAAQGVAKPDTHLHCAQHARQGNVDTSCARTATATANPQTLRQDANSDFSARNPSFGSAKIPCKHSRLSNRLFSLSPHASRPCCSRGCDPASYSAHSFRRS